MSKLNRNNLRRKGVTREPKTQFIVLCEGKNTEPAYFEALKQLHHHTLIEIKILPAVGVPYTQAEEAVKIAKQKQKLRREWYEKNDQIWVVFDRDAFPRYDEAVHLCETKGIRVARSNPCFELWLILHHSDYDKPDGSNAVQKALEKVDPEYQASGRKLPSCSTIMDKVVKAEYRANVMLQRREDEGNPFGAPSTTMFQLTKAITEASSKAKPKNA